LRTAALDVKPLVQSLEVEPFIEFLNGIASVTPTVRLMSAGIPSEREILLGWIDEWLDSGKADDGDDPRRRNFKSARHVAGAAYDYSTHGRLQLLGGGDSLHLWIDEYDVDPETGKRRLLGPPIESLAKEQLVFFLLSELRFRLAKCQVAECGSYFQLRKWKRLYPQGTLCEVCQRKRSQQSAKAATAKDRRDVKLALQNGIAMRFGKQIRRNPLWYRDEDLKNKIAEFINAKLGDRELVRAAYPKGITGKWVANAKNWKPIEAAAKGGK